MKAQRDEASGKWKIQYRYTDWQGNNKKSTKRGFNTKREAEEWLRHFLTLKQSEFNMRFADFLELYYEDMEKRLREHTMLTKKNIIETKILPHFGNLLMNEITPGNIRKWQNTLMQQSFAETYLKTINNQLSCLFNYAVKYFDLKSNPCTKAGSIGKSNAGEMQFWTKQEFMKFIDCVMDKRQAYTAFMVLYFTGIRIGEMLALTLEDIDFKKLTMNISKSYQRIGTPKRDVITPPKTPKSKRVINLPEFLANDLQDYLNSLYQTQDGDRIFPFTKHLMESEMKRGIKGSGVKRIRLHDLRHSHASNLIEMGFSPLEIAERLGHERIETTMNTYAHLYPNKQRQMAARINTEYNEDL